MCCVTAITGAVRCAEFCRVRRWRGCLILLAGCGGSDAAGNEPPPGGNPPTNPPVLPPANPPGTPDLGTNASLNGKIPFPGDNAWNVRIDTAQVDPNSDALIASIGTTTASTLIGARRRRSTGFRMWWWREAPRG